MPSAESGGPVAAAAACLCQWLSYGCSCWGEALLWGEEERGCCSHKLRIWGGVLFCWAMPRSARASGQPGVYGRRVPGEQGRWVRACIIVFTVVLAFVSMMVSIA